METAAVPATLDQVAAPVPAPASPEGVRAKLAAMPPSAKIKLGVAAAVLLALLVGVALWSGRSEWKVLYANLPEKDAAAVVAQLVQQNVPYRYTEGGGAILVPAERVHDMRLRLASQGLPKASVAGNEILDNPRFGQTDRQERLSMQRALEGELARTIMRLEGVEDARVHLALPNQNGFFREQQKPSASVVLTLHPGHTLGRGQSAAIVHLVSSSVPELAPKAVSLLDQRGELLAGPGEDSGKSLDEQQLKYQRNIEAALQKRVQEIVEAVVGRENLRATVTAEIDFSQSEATSEQFRPNQTENAATVRSQQNTETFTNTPPAPAGVPGAATNQPPVPATAPIAGASAPLQPAGGTPGAGNGKREAITNYEVDKTVRVTRNATGVIKRVTAAVVVNHRSVTDAKGKSSTQPVSQEELDKLTALVQEAVGYSRDRGDSVRVISAPFRIEAPSADDTPWWKQPWVIELARAGAIPAALVLVALALMFGVIRPTLKEAFAPPPPPVPPEGEGGAGGDGVRQLDALVDDPTALPGPDGQLPALEAPKEDEQLEEARRMARENPLAVATILRQWVNGEPPP